MAKVLQYKFDLSEEIKRLYNAVWIASACCQILEVLEMVYKKGDLYVLRLDVVSNVIIIFNINNL
jgi:hypothetical protein